MANANVTLTFDTGTNPDTPLVQTQNRITLADAAPAGGGQSLGIRIAKVSAGFHRRHRPALQCRQHELL